MVKKIYTVYTKDHRLLGDLEYNVFAENISEAIKKVEKSMAKERFVMEAKFLCDLDEDEDLIEYKKEREEDEKSIKNQ